VSPAAIEGLTLDTGALIALDHPSKSLDMQRRLDTTRRRGGALCVPVEVIAQAWRGSRQVRLARLLNSPDVEIARMDLSTARAIGMLCAQTGHDDVVDVHVALCARQRNHAVVTSDSSDIARVDSSLTILAV
jgi:hypothetical protein